MHIEQAIAHLVSTLSEIKATVAEHQKNQTALNVLLNSIPKKDMSTEQRSKDKIDG